MVEGAKNFMVVPVELVESVMAYLTARFPNWETKKRGVKEVIWASNALGEISCKGLPAPILASTREYVRGVIDGLSGVGFRLEAENDADADTDIDIDTDIDTDIEEV